MGIFKTSLVTIKKICPLLMIHFSFLLLTNWKKATNNGPKYSLASKMFPGTAGGVFLLFGTLPLSAVHGAHVPLYVCTSGLFSTCTNTLIVSTL